MSNVQIEKKEETTFTVKSKENEFTVDKKGEEGISPPDALLAGLGTCIGVYLQKYLKGKKIRTNDFAVKVKAEFCKQPPLRFKEIGVELDLKGAEIEEKDKHRLLNFVRNCPVHNTLENPPEIKIDLC